MMDWGFNMARSKSIEDKKYKEYLVKLSKCKNKAETVKTIDQIFDNMVNSISNSKSKKQA